MSARSKSTRPGTRVDILNKKVPENPRYKDVKSVLDTGASLSKHMAKIEDIRRNYRYRNNEIFKRMKVTTFVQLVLQVNDIRQNERQQSRAQSMADSARPETTDLNFNGGGGDGSSPVPSLALTEGDYGGQSDAISTSRSTLQSVIAGVGEFDLSGEYVDDPTPRSDAPEQESECPYLLLDLRDKDVYDQCHIITAECYPTAMLSRAVNNYTRNILNYRNKTGKIIVIYDEDERISTTAATTFVDRGFDNVFLLSGGLKVAAQKFPGGLITGTLPPSCRPPPPTSKKAPKVKTPPQVPADRKEFSMDDLDKLQEQLDENLIPRDTGSRLSRATPQANPDPNAKILSSRSATSASNNAAHSSPWK